MNQLLADGLALHPAPQGWELPAALFIVGLLVLADIGPRVGASWRRLALRRRPGKGVEHGED